MAHYHNSDERNVPEQIAILLFQRTNFSQRVFVWREKVYHDYIEGWFGTGCGGYDVRVYSSVLINRLFVHHFSTGSSINVFISRTQKETALSGLDNA